MTRLGWFERRRERKRKESNIVGTIWRRDRLDVMSEAEAEHWDFRALPWGWSIIHDVRRRATS